MIYIINKSVLIRLTVYLTMIILIDNGISVCEATRKKSRPPLIEDSINKHHHHNRPTHCPFGNQTHEIGERWKPNLQPFGVYYCIRCQCVAVQRKNRIVAKVRCKNLKNECPKPSCDDPVLLPERCCKTCPGEEEFLEFTESSVEPEVNKTLLELQINQTNSDSKADTSSSANGQLTDNKEQLDDIQAKTKAINDENSQNNLIGEPTHKCYYERMIYEDGSQWKTERDDCEMCFCQRGRVKCEQEICPKLSCSNQTRLTGSCCPVCANQLESLDTNISSTKGCYLDGDKKFHLAGSRWHPYLPPFGFDKCSLCTCLADSLTIQCERNTDCPALTCPEHEAYRENSMDCCKRCPNVLPVKSIVSVDQLGDQRSIVGGGFKSPYELMALGGCKFRGRVYPNGDEWHPTVQPFGEVKCVKCRCKDSHSKCKRIVCPKIIACSIVINKNNECCPICADDLDGMMMKNQPENPLPTRKRGGKKRRRNNGRRTLHRQERHRHTSLSEREKPEKSV